MKKNLSTVILVVMLLTGLSLLLYPTISDFWNSFHQSQVINTYVENISSMTNHEYEKMLEDAREYNRQLINKGNRYYLTESEKEVYNSILNLGDGVIGYVEIDKIDVLLPIYHGEDEATLQVAIGHMEGSSFPVGGKGTHSVVMGHRGLPSARLFTDLDQMIEGDTFRILVLDEVLTYEIDQIRIVLPTELEELEIDKNEDYMTLVTCTPYGINSHRLLLRGHRVDNSVNTTLRVSADAFQIEPILVAPALAIPMIILLLIFVYVFEGKRKVRR